MEMEKEKTQIKEEIIALLRSTGREGIENVIKGLEENGFFEAPASTRFHLNSEGGLAIHSLNVCRMGLVMREQLVAMNPGLAGKLPVDSVIVSTLLHDVCKADVYRKTVKRARNIRGFFEDLLGYEVDYSQFPLGHGEKSVIVVLRMGFNLTDDEIMAIRWHMHAWEIPHQSPEAKGNYQKAKQICPLCSLVQAADNLAANILEAKVES